MADRRDRPPVLRALFLLITLVGTALALAALAPARPDAAAADLPGADATNGALAPEAAGATGAAPASLQGLRSVGSPG
ncbi:MAG: hypothetical protein AMXMBFR78_06470 [Rubrivivax sp.]|jgi:hypothetical protein|nr:hypothetical protein [Rubrivivax sp.]